MHIVMIGGTGPTETRAPARADRHPGQAFHEGPDDIHTVGRNAGATQPARFLAVLIKNENAPPVLPAR